MTTGRVENHHAVVPVALRRPGHSDVAIEFVVDTGFVGFLTLPEATVTNMGLPYWFDTRANLADDSVVLLPVHAATILGNGHPRDVGVLALGTRPLLGMSLLDGSELIVRCHDGGLVAIEPM